jgi:hypothetical protein
VNSEETHLTLALAGGAFAVIEAIATPGNGVPPQEPFKLGKGSYFVKARLVRLPQTGDEWQVDIRRLNRRKQEWLGFVLNQTDDYILADISLDGPRTVNDLARLIADAIRRSLVNRPDRPYTVLLRDNPTSRELLPHLNDIKIEVGIQNSVPQWEGVLQEFAEQSE